MSVRHFGTLVRHEFNAVYEGKEGTLAAFDRAWYKPDAAEKLGQRTRLFASPRCPMGPVLGAVTVRGRSEARHITGEEVT